MEKQIRQWISFRVTELEYSQIVSHQSATMCRSLSAYARKLLLQKPVIVRYRNSSTDDFLEEMISLRKELHAIGNNFNQAVKRLHTIDTVYEIKTWILINAPFKDLLSQQIRHIEEKLQQIYDLWLSK